MTSSLRTLAILSFQCLIASAFAQGFPLTSMTWSLPAGGEVYNGVNQGFWSLGSVGNDTGSDSWSTLDIDGDGLVDLVCTGTRVSNGSVTEFSPANNSYWKVYLNTGNGFSSSSTTWSLPAGGEVYNGVNQGFWSLGSFGNDTGSDSWSTLDIDGDGRPDLVCTGTRVSNGYVTEFSPANNSYWKVYLNTGTGFSSSSTTWSLPAGGEVYNGVNQGFWSLGSFGNDTGSDSWRTLDIDGDELVDLVCTGTRVSNGYVTEFSPANNSYWKVYLNTGNGFSSSSTTWSLPAGGEVYNGVNQGFWSLGSFGNDAGSDSWRTLDIDGDELVDLVCTGTRVSNGSVTEFSPANNSYWKVYLNTGNGFSSSSTTWSLPTGGEVYNGVNQGFWSLGSVGNDTGSDSWSTLDIDGDGLVDLVCTGTRVSNGSVTEFSPANNSYWKVYLNTGNGFSSSSTTWSLPAGGEVYNGVNQGFWSLGSVGNDTGSDSWRTLDIDGDGSVDLVCTGTRVSNGSVTEFSPANNSYWKVYLQANTTGLAEMTEGSGMMMFPNPTHGLLTIGCKEAVGGVVLMDIQGRTVLNATTTTARFTIDVSDLAPGLYTVQRVAAQGQVSRSSLLVQ